MEKEYANNAIAHRNNMLGRIVQYAHKKYEKD